MNIFCKIGLHRYVRINQKSIGDILDAMGIKWVWMSYNGFISIKYLKTFACPRCPSVKDDIKTAVTILSSDLDNLKKHHEDRIAKQLLVKDAHWIRLRVWWYNLLH